MKRVQDRMDEPHRISWAKDLWEEEREEEEEEEE